LFVTDNTREDPTQTNGFDLTDMGNAERLASLYGEDLRHVYRMRPHLEAQDAAARVELQGHPAVATSSGRRP
jgi:hypothetical protein